MNRSLFRAAVAMLVIKKACTTHVKERCRYLTDALADGLDLNPDDVHYEVKKLSAKIPKNVFKDPVNPQIMDEVNILLSRQTFLVLLSN